MGTAVADSQAKMGPKDNVFTQQMLYSQPCSLAQIQAKEADVQAIADLSRALEKKVPILP